MKRSKKLVSSLMVFVLIVSLFSFNSFADDVITYRLDNFTWVSGTDSANKSFLQNGGYGVTRVYYTNATGGKSTGYYKLNDRLVSGNSYTLSYKVKNYSVAGTTDLLLYLSPKANEVPTDAVLITSFSTSGMSTTSYKDFSVQFQFPDKFNGQQVYLVAVIAASGSTTGFYVTDFEFNNNNPVTKDGFFDGLLAKIQEFFDNLWSGISEGFNNILEKIQDTASVIVDGIGDFFDKLIDYLLYFQHPVEKNAEGVPINTDTGEPVYVNPFESVIEDVLAQIDEWISDIDNFIWDMYSARDNVTSYMDTGKQLIDGVITGVPILAAIILFVAGFYVIRKVVGQ